jgi:class 3 adenylate cyclase
VTPEHLAEKIRRQRPSEGERRIVTVLFVDTVGSTPLAEKLGEEAMYSLMREALARMSDAVHHYEGYVATFTGDGLMALFGAPIAHEDSAHRAVAAALRMQASLEEYGAEIERRNGVGCRSASSSRWPKDRCPTRLPSGGTRNACTTATASSG